MDYTFLETRLNLSLIPLRDLEMNGLDERTDGQQSDPMRVSFVPFAIRNPKM